MKKFISSTYVIIGSLTITIFCGSLIANLPSNIKFEQLPLYKRLAVIFTWVGLVVFIVSIVVRIIVHFQRSEQKDQEKISQEIQSGEPIKIGLTRSNPLVLMFKGLKSWQGVAVLVATIIAGILLPLKLKSACIVAGPILSGIGLKKLSRQQLSEIGATQASTTEQPASVHNWQTTCAIRSDTVAPFPDKWTYGQLIFENGNLIWFKGSDTKDGIAEEINIAQQNLQAIQTRDVEGSEGFSVNRSLFIITVCQTNNGQQVLLAVGREFANLLAQTIKATQSSVPKALIITAAYQS